MHERLTPADLRFTPPTLPENQLSAFLADSWGIEGEFAPLRGERDQNFRVTTADGRRYVLKISSPLEDPALVDFQLRALQHVAARDDTLPVPRVLPSRRGHAVEHFRDANATHVVRLLSYLPGTPLAEHPPLTLAYVRDIGRLQGRLCHALQGFSHPAETHFMPWDILNGLVVRRELRENYLGEDVARRSKKALQRLENDSLPRMLALPTQVIHNDAHAGNVLCDGNTATVSGLIDFGDLVRRPLIVDLATSGCSCIERHADPLAVARELVGGFREHIQLPDEQLRLYYDALLARAILTVQLLAFRIAHTDVSEETRRHAIPETITGLDRLLAIDAADFYEAIRA